MCVCIRMRVRFELHIPPRQKSFQSRVAIPQALLCVKIFPNRQFFFMEYYIICVNTFHNLGLLSQNGRVMQVKRVESVTMKICKRRNLTQEEFRKWNALYSCRKLEKLIALNFQVNSFYYVLEVDTQGFNMDRNGILEDFKLYVIRELRPLVSEFNYIYSINQQSDGRFYVHLVTNATENIVSQVFSKCWFYGSLYSVESVCNSSSALSIAKAMTLDVFGTQGQRKKRMYVPSRGLVH